MTRVSGTVKSSHTKRVCTHVVLGREDQETARDIQTLQGVEDAERLAFDESVILAAVCGGKIASATRTLTLKGQTKAHG